MRRDYFILILVVFSGWLISGLTNQALADDIECIAYDGVCRSGSCDASSVLVPTVTCTDPGHSCCRPSALADPAAAWIIDSGPAQQNNANDAPFTGTGDVGAAAGGGAGGPFTGVGAGGAGAAGGGSVSCPAGTSPEGGTCIPTGVGLSTGSVSTRFGNVFSFPAICFSGPVLCVLATFLSWILTVLGVVTVISFVIAGLQYMLSLGDPKSVETAKAHMKWSIVGLIVALSGVIAILQIDSWLGV